MSISKKIENLTFAELQNKIQNEERKISKLNKVCHIQTRTEEYFGNIYDNTAGDVYYCNRDDKYYRIISEVEEELNNKKSELKDVMQSVKLIKESMATDKVFKIEVDKILGYNQVVKPWVYGNKAGVKQTEAGARYQYQIAKEIERLGLRDYVKAKPAKYRLTVEAFVNYAQKDVDGLKAFVDCLVRGLGQGDRKLYDDSQFLNVDIFKPKALRKRHEKEFFLIKFTEIDETVMENKSMYTEYLQQKMAVMIDKDNK